MRHKRSPAAVHRAFVAGKVEMGQVSVKVLRFFPTSLSFHHCSIFIFHLSATGAVSFLQTDNFTKETLYLESPDLCGLCIAYRKSEREVVIPLCQ